MMRCLVGTTKGLCVFRNVAGKLALEQIHFKGLPISMIHFDRNSGTCWVGLSMKHWGAKIFRSKKDLNEWQELTTPIYPAQCNVKPGVPASLRLIWSAYFDAHSGKLWLGTEPGGLFESMPDGQFELNQALWNNPDRVEHWFGGGRDQAGIHTILGHPQDRQFLLLGVSCGGVYVSRDGGTSWQMKNKGLRADYLPEPLGPYGHDPHALEICATQPDTIWQQNHCGVFVTHDGAETWKDVTPADDYGRYGFPIVIDHQDPLRAWIIPAESDDQRVAKDLRLVICHTNDGGQTWIKQTRGLPQENCFDLVFRHAFDRREELMCFGTTTGNLFVSNDDGESWSHQQSFLPPIHSLLII
ncbi:MAG: glycosyl hydrolase [Saprospiraceae bacterium]|nr:glycosyl hydrolase [Saprospiraceae bacterium]